MIISKILPRKLITPRPPTPIFLLERDSLICMRPTSFTSFTRTHTVVIIYVMLFYVNNISFNTSRGSRTLVANLIRVRLLRAHASATLHY